MYENLGRSLQTWLAPPTPLPSHSSPLHSLFFSGVRPEAPGPHSTRLSAWAATPGTIDFELQIPRTDYSWICWATCHSLTPLPVARKGAALVTCWPGLGPLLTPDTEGGGQLPAQRGLTVGEGAAGAEGARALRARPGSVRGGPQVTDEDPELGSGGQQKRAGLGWCLSSPP